MPVELGVEDARLIEVVRADLQQLLLGLLAQPLRKACVVLRAAGLREPAVGDLADQDVLEAVRRLAADRRALRPGDQVAQQQVVEHVLQLVGIVFRGQVIHRTREEGSAHDRAALQQDLLAGRQPVDARTDQRLQSVGDPVAAVAALLDEHADRLLDEERVALRLLEQARRDVLRDLVLREQRCGELFTLLARERLELDRS